MMKTTTMRGLVGLTTTLLVFSLLVAAGIGVAAASPSVSVDPVATTGLNPGDTFDIAVLVDSDTDNLKAAEVKLHYDTSVLEVNGVDDGNLFTSFQTICKYGTHGVVTYAMVSDTGTYPPASGTLMTVHFVVKSTAPDGTSDLDLQNVVLKDEDKVELTGVVVTDGTVTVGTATPPTPTVEVSPQETTGISQGDTFDIAVLVDSDTDNLKAAEVKLHYDTSVLEVNGVDDGNLFTSFQTICKYGTPGVVEYSMVSDTGTYPPASGTLMTVHFVVKSTAPDGTSDLDLQNVVLKDEDKVELTGVVVTDGTVVVSSNNPPTVTVTYPVSGTVSGTIDVTATATDSDGSVAQVAFYLMPAGTLIDTPDTNGADGWSVSLDTTTAADGTGYQIKAVATDNEGATGENTGSAFAIDNSCPCDFCYNLDAGWNFVSVPRTIEGSNGANTVFNLSQGETCLYYDCAEDEWLSSGAVDVVPCQGYWVGKVASDQICVDFAPGTGSTNPPEQDLCKGWNMIGHIHTSSMPVGEFATATTLGDNIAQIWQWDQTNGWEGYPFGGFADMTPGRGYWLLANAECTMSGTP